MRPHAVMFGHVATVLRPNGLGPPVARNRDREAVAHRIADVVSGFYLSDGLNRVPLGLVRRPYRRPARAPLFREGSRVRRTV
ncbi:hypothetical protein ACI3PL_23060, partial [Lacticaseibacillus paracasei]